MKFEWSFQVKYPHRSCKDPSVSLGSRVFLGCLFPVTSLMVHSVYLKVFVIFGNKSWKLELRMELRMELIVETTNFSMEIF